LINHRFLSASASIATKNWARVVAAAAARFKHPAVFQAVQRAKILERQLDKTQSKWGAEQKLSMKPNLRAGTL
jgi:hypothetical protein